MEEEREGELMTGEWDIWSSDEEEAAAAKGEVTRKEPAEEEDGEEA